MTFEYDQNSLKTVTILKVFKGDYTMDCPACGISIYFDKSKNIADFLD